MRLLTSARIVVVDGDPDHRAQLCAALASVGLTEVHAAANPEEARQLGAAGVDLCILDTRRLPRPVADFASYVAPNPFASAGVPGLLIAGDAGRETRRAALAAGYAVVLAPPVAPRLFYRRIGSILQRARRAGRTARLPLAADPLLTSAAGTGGA
jgi:CheY-like chemotaxis protein